jgi:hypothetical protein
MKDRARERNDRDTLYDVDQAESMLYGLALEIRLEDHLDAFRGRVAKLEERTG